MTFGPCYGVLQAYCHYFYTGSCHALITLLLSSLIITIAGCASSGVPINNNVTDALANPARSDADRERDSRDKPLLNTQPNCHLNNAGLRLRSAQLGPHSVVKYFTDEARHVPPS